MEQENPQGEKKKARKITDLEKVETTTLRGRVIVFEPEKSEFAKNLGLNKKADYKKKK